MLNHIELFASDVRHIFSKDRSIKKPFVLLKTHIRLKVKQKYFEAFHIKRTQEKLLGMTISFSDYGRFCHLWREIFISEDYSFKANKPFIVDVGSNIGMSVCFFKYVFPDSEILAFEPEPAAFSYLQKNIANNGFTGVTAYNIAIGPEDTTVALWRPAGIEASGVNSVLPGFLPPDSIKMEVPQKRLSPFIGNRHVDFLKLDTEGAEYGIFKEMDGKFANINRIVLEAHQRPGSQNDPIPDILTALDRNGFRYAITDVFLSQSDDAYAIMVDARRK